MFLNTCAPFVFLLLFISPSTNATATTDALQCRREEHPINKTFYRERAREMFMFGYNNYVAYAYPLDELDPIHCRGRGPDPNPSNLNINDVLGAYSLTLVDALDALALLGDRESFVRAVNLVRYGLSFDTNSTVQVFEATIRVLGGLLSAHLICTEPAFAMAPPDYDNELLSLAHDLATRLLPAFDASSTGLPHPRVTLSRGVPRNWRTDTCPAGAGSLLLEFGILSALVDDPVFFGVADRAARAVWSRRDNTTWLLGSALDVVTGAWVDRMSGVGAGSDSFFEYMLKAYVLFGDEDHWRLFQDAYTAVTTNMRPRTHPLFVNVDMHSAGIANRWVDSLQAFLPALQVLAGDLAGAVHLHDYFWQVWQQHGAMPERFDWQRQTPVYSIYPLRPELAEATYSLYRATRDPHYLRVGAAMLDDLETHTKVRCGYATLHDVSSKTKEDRMESFFLSETLKYLFLLFDEDNIIHTRLRDHVFSTEGHWFPLLPRFHTARPSPLPPPQSALHMPHLRTCEPPAMWPLLGLPYMQ